MKSVVGTSEGNAHRPPADESKRSTRRRLTFNFLLLAVGEVAAKVFTFLVFTFLARLLGAERYGDLEFVLASMVFFTLPVDFGLRVYGTREIARAPQQASVLIRDIAALRWAAACGSFLFLLIFAALLPKSADVKSLLLLYGLSLFMFPALLEWLFQGRELMHWVVLASLVRNGVFAAFVLTLSTADMALYLFGYFELVSVAAVGTMCIVTARGRLGVRLSLKGLRGSALWRRFRNAAPIGVGELTWVFLWYFPTIQIGLLIGGESMGWYGATHRLVIALHSFVWIYFMNLLPTMSRRSAESAEHFASLMRNSMSFAAWGSVFLALMTVLLSPKILHLVYGAEYVEGHLVLATLIWVIPVTMLSGHFRYGLIAHDLQRLEMMAATIAAVIGIGLGFTLIPTFGALGAAIALLGGNSVHFVLACAFMKWHVRWVSPIPHVVGPAAAAAAGIALYLYLQTRSTIVIAVCLAAVVYLLAFAASWNLKPWLLRRPFAP